MTRGQLVSRVAFKLSLNTTAGDTELAYLQDLANEGVVDVLLKTHCRVEIGELTMVVGQKDYRLDTTVLAILTHTIEASTSPITLVTPADINDMRRASTVASPVRYLAFEGDLVMVYPTPSEADIIRFLFVARPTAMTQDSHDPSNSTYGGIPTEYHRAIEYYMLWQAAEYDDKAAPQKPLEYKSLYQAELVDVKKAHRKKAQRGLNPARVGYPGNVNYPKRNDVYPA